jgi:hypothetical protein
LWLDIGLDGSATPLSRHWAGLPGEPASVLISPQPVYRPSLARDPRQWRAKDVVPGWRFVILDIDASDVTAAGTTVAEIRVAIERFMPPTWAIVLSGSGGLHVWWHVPPTAADVVCQLERRLCGLFQGDLAQARSRPSLRLPGTVNLKWKKPAPVTHADVRQCRILSLDEASCSVEDFSALTVHSWLPAPYAYGEIDAIDIPEWIVETLAETYGDRHGELTLQHKGHRMLAVPDKCPMCGGDKTAWIDIQHLHPKIRCHRARQCVQSIDLRTLADAAGVAVSDEWEVDPNELYRRHDAEARLVLPPSVMYSDDARADEQTLIRQAFDDAWQHAHTSTDDTRRLTVIESTVGAGKDYVLSRAVEERADVPPGVDIYAKSQFHAREKISEWPSASRPVRLHVSPVSLLDRDGNGCQNHAALSRHVAAGWEAGRFCTSCPLKAGCTVTAGYVDLQDGPGQRVDVYTARRIEHARAQDDAVAWVDEGFSPVTGQVITRKHLTAFARSGAALMGYAPIARHVLDIWKTLPVSTGPITPRDWGKALRRQPEPPSAVSVDMPTDYGFPKHIYAVLYAAWKAAQSDQSDFLLWFTRDELTLWTRTLDRLPKSTIWTNATFFLYADIIETWTGGEVHRVGRTLEPRHLARLHYRHPFAVRGGYQNRKRVMVLRADGRKYLDGRWRFVVREAVRVAKERYHLDGGEGVPRVLLATYKDVVTNGIDGVTPLTAELGVDAVDYYERLVGVNTYSGWEILIMLGEPNPGASGAEAAYAALYGELSEGMMYRLSAEALYQTEGRLRAVTADSPQVVVAITPNRPLHWGESGELIEDSAHIMAADTSLGYWAQSARLLECMSHDLARVWINTVLNMCAEYERMGDGSLLATIERQPTPLPPIMAACVAVCRRFLDEGPPWQLDRLERRVGGHWLDRAAAVAGLSIDPRKSDCRIYTSPGVDYDVTLADTYVLLTAVLAHGPGHDYASDAEHPTLTPSPKWIASRRRPVTVRYSLGATHSPVEWFRIWRRTR